MPGTGSFLFDTNILMFILNGDASVLERASAENDLFALVIAIGELMFGAERSSKPETNFKLVEELAERMSIVICDRSVARNYGRIKNALKLQGTPIPENDIWIAAIAARWNLTLVTRDRHFEHVGGLRCVLW